MSTDPIEPSHDTGADPLPQSGNPNRDRSFLSDTPPTQVDEDAVQNNSTNTDGNAGSDAAAAQDA